MGRRHPSGCRLRPLGYLSGWALSAHSYVASKTPPPQKDPHMAHTFKRTLSALAIAGFALTAGAGIASADPGGNGGTAPGGTSQGGNGGTSQGGAGGNGGNGSGGNVVLGGPVIGSPGTTTGPQNAGNGGNGGNGGNAGDANGGNAGDANGGSANGGAGAGDTTTTDNTQNCGFVFCF
ncbi:hypothetical protein CJ179_04040 [Rhodococcus sp. ACS1]|nr:hypothetical protein CJ179_04040 [Rhodococcus sp. ACS1]